MPRRRRFGLFVQAGRGRTAAFEPEIMAAPLSSPRDPGLLMNRRQVADPEARLEWASSASRPNGAAKATATASIPKANILLVDDRADKLLAMEAIVSSLGENIVKARSGKEALRQLLHMDFAVILLDVSMPVMDGFETAALIRTRPRCEHTPIIFITAYGDETHVARGYRLGAVDYILTPVVPEVLRAKVSVFVELFRKTEEIRRQAARLRERAAQLHELTRAALAINAAGSAEKILPIVADRARALFGARQAVA